MVPQAFSNIAQPGYRSGTFKKDLAKLDYLSCVNISIANFLSTFGMASKSCLNNLRLTRDQREWLFDQFHATMNGSTREQIMQQLFSITQQEASQMQFMLDISRNISKAYADLVANFNSNLTKAVLIKRDAYLRHAHPNKEGQQLKSTSPRSQGYVLPTHAGTPVHGATALLPPSPREMQRRSWLPQRSWPRRQHTQH